MFKLLSPVLFLFLVFSTCSNSRKNSSTPATYSNIDSINFHKTMDSGLLELKNRFNNIDYKLKQDSIQREVNLEKIYLKKLKRIIADTIKPNHIYYEFRDSFDVKRTIDGADTTKRIRN